MGKDLQCATLHGKLISSPTIESNIRNISFTKKDIFTFISQYGLNNIVLVVIWAGHHFFSLARVQFYLHVLAHWQGGNGRERKETAQA
jgi:hypothetical protein